MKKNAAFSQGPKDPRMASFSALLDFEKRKRKIDSSLSDWLKKTKPTSLNYQLAQHIAYGVCKRKLTLDFYASQLDIKGSLKLREKTILRMALYQLLFMDKVPFYAIVDESVNLAKKVISQQTGSFFNALLRKLENKKFIEPNQKHLESLYSYPHYFIDLLMKQYGKKQAEDLLKIMNLPPAVFIRQRTKEKSPILKKKEIQTVYEKHWPILKLCKASLVNKIKDDPNYYVQNVAQAYLIERLAAVSEEPASIIDLCASPGGKILAAADLYQDALLFANDVSEKRLEKLKDNIRKYHLDVQISCEPAEMLHRQRQFDLVIVDVPCSNSGVLHRRAEARWSITKDHLHGLNRLQKEIVKNACKLVSDEGRIWYMTCSILEEENEKLIKDMCEKLPLRLEGKMYKIVPNIEGWDGGFGCVLKKL